MAEARIDKWLWASRIFQDPYYRCRSMQERTGFHQRYSGEAVENDKAGRSDTGKETACHVLI